MRMELRFILAIVLMIGVLTVTNILFPPVEEEPPEEEPAPEVVEEPEEPPEEEPDPEAPPVDPPEPDPDPEVEEVAEEPEVPADVEDRRVAVEGPLYRFEFSSVGGALRSVQLLEHESLARPGPVELVPEGVGTVLTTRVPLQQDTLDFSRREFEAVPAQDIRLEAGDEPATLTLRHEDPAGGPGLEVSYTFHPDSYVVEVEGRLTGIDRGWILTDLGPRLEYNEADPGSTGGFLTGRGPDMAYVANHLAEGVEMVGLADITEPGPRDGPHRWVATKSRYFLLGVLPSEQEGAAEHLGAVVVDDPFLEEDRAALSVSQSVLAGGRFGYRLLAAPQDYHLLQGLGHDLQEVSPMGWAFLRPILEPFVGAITWLLKFFHETLSIGYGWVLILFGLLLRVLLFPLNHRAMKAQLKNMAVQPLLKEIQEKHRDDPEKLQKEMMRLYREHGFNPLGGCWPMLLPWPILIALFFTFRSTIELRGVPFAWIPDLALPDPIFLLPVLLGASMFLMQWVSMRTLEEVNPQMKMMMYFMPVMLVFIFGFLPAGLNLYYLTYNLAALPQQHWIAQQRKKARAEQPSVAHSGAD